MLLPLGVCYPPEFSLESVLEILVHPWQTVLHNPTEPAPVDLEDWNKMDKCGNINYIQVQGRAKKIPACLNFPALFLPTDLGSQCTARQP